jgi:hypothetical protein
MANTILLKRKGTAGAPSLASLAIGEGCLVVPDNTLYYKKDAGTLLSWPAGAGAGDMLASVYDPTAKGADAFSMGNMVETATKKILTDTERAAIAANTAKVSYNAAAVTAEINAAIDALIAGAPGALNTLKELADAMANDAAFSATVTAALAAKLDANSTIDGGTI